MKIKKYNSIGKEEIKAANKVLRQGILSDFVGSKSKKFYGGKYVQQFEKNLTKYFKTKYAVVTNSWTSGLIAALGSIGIEPGDEVICTPWTMSACAMSILHWNAIPIFVDIEKGTYNYNLYDLKKKITSKTKAIIAVDIFGQSENIKSIKKIIKKKKIKLISDSAQAIGAKYKDHFAGTMGDIGGFSLNCHKHINTGEGGIIVTNSKNFANRCRLIRNHAESVVNYKNATNLSNMIGYNFRMGEIEAAIGIEQLKKLKKIVSFRQKLAMCLLNKIKNLPGLELPVLKKSFSHSFYVIPFNLDLSKIKYNRSQVVKILKNAGVQGLNIGYQNLHLLPIFKYKIAYGKKSFPWKNFRKKIIYKPGDCKVAETLHKKTFFYLSLCAFDFKMSHMEKFGNIIKSKWRQIQN
jgi:perosamine synthetase